MKVVYKTQMLWELNFAINRAIKSGKCIEHIELTPAEWLRFEDEMPNVTNGMAKEGEVNLSGHKTYSYYGVQLKTL